MAVWVGVAVLVAALSPVGGARLQRRYGNARSPSITEDVIRQCGFSPERHYMTSHDGYVTTVFRMGSGAAAKANATGRAVLFQHGFLSSSDTWFQLGTDSLPCLVAKEGFDVWVSNARGNHYSKNHTTLPIKSYAYWNFSFHEMAVNDIATTIDYIRFFTRRSHVSYIGHSMGGAINFALLAAAPLFDRKVDVSVSLAPACFLGHASNLVVRALAKLLPLVQDKLTKLTYGEIYAVPGLWKKDLNDKSNKTYVMEIILGLAHAINLEQHHRGSGYITDSTSIRTAAHLATHMRDGTFAWYDWGKAGNMAAYGQQKPPAYQLDRITTRQFIMYGEADDLVVPKDALRLCSALSSGVGTCYKVPKRDFGHLDFVRSSEAKQLVYSVVLKELGPSSVESPATATRPNTRPAGCWPVALRKGSVGNPAGRARG